ncbi:MAG: hypothetical protein AAB389_02435 [Patescibacteria group bacterium]
MDFWDAHGFFGGVALCFFLAFFPRLTLAFLAFFTDAIGPTFWGVVGWFICPRIVVAVIATTLYWTTNPIMCVFAWIIALSGEGVEKRVAIGRRSRGHGGGVTAKIGRR